MSGEDGTQGAADEDPCGCGPNEDGEEPEHVPAAGDDAAGAKDGGEPDAPPAKTEIEECEDKLKRTMADYQNMMRQKEHDIEARAAARVEPVLADMLQIRDDIERAHGAFAESGVDASGLGGILRNVEALLERNGVEEIDALGEHFDPDMHESVSVVEDNALEEGTVTKVARKGYICRKRVLRPTLVEISRRGDA